MPVSSCVDDLHFGGGVAGAQAYEAGNITTDATVLPTGRLHLRAGRDIRLEPRSKVQKGGYLRAEQVVCYPAVGEWRFEYFLTDHLGNNRVLFSDLNGDGRIDPAGEVLQENHYYAFGLEMEGAWTDGNTGASDNRLKYNGKEFNQDLGLYEYGARWYDPTIGRFTGVDPIADQFPHVSTYNYAENEPIANIDLHGLQKVSIHLIGAIISNQNGSTQRTPFAFSATVDQGQNNRTNVAGAVGAYGFAAEYNPQSGNDFSPAPGEAVNQEVRQKISIRSKTNGFLPS